MYRYLVGALALAPLSTVALAQDTAPDDGTPTDAEARDMIVVTAARTQLPASALPLTVDIIDSHQRTRDLGVLGPRTSCITGNGGRIIHCGDG